MIECTECEKEVPVDEIVYCINCGVALCNECGNVGLCSKCEDTWQAEEKPEMEEEPTPSVHSLIYL
jgi:hypothetical protein